MRPLLLAALTACASPEIPTVTDTTETADTVEDTPSDTIVTPDTDETDVPDDTDETDVPDTDLPPVPCERPAGFAPTWSIHREDDPLGMMMSVWGTSPEDVWIVGGQKGGEGFVLRGSHDAGFTELALPDETPMLHWVHGMGPNHLWVGGVAGSLLRWDGAAWYDHDLPEEGAVWGIHARSRTDALVVGGPFFGNGAPFAYRWDGSTWASVALPEDFSADASLFKVHETDDGYVVVGSGGRSLAISGLGAQALPSPTPFDMVTVHRDAGSCHPPMAVGGLSSGYAWTFDGTAWSEVSTNLSKLNGVHMLGDGSFVAVGDYGGTGWYDAATQTWTPDFPPATFELLHGVWVASNGDAYAVGGNFLTSGDTFAGVVLVAPNP